MVDLGDKKHFRSHHGKRAFVGGKTHINGSESIWGYAKTGRAKFRRVRIKSFYFDLKECEFRFNDRQFVPYYAENLSKKPAVLVMSLNINSGLPPENRLSPLECPYDSIAPKMRLAFLVFSFIPF